MANIDSKAWTIGPVNINQAFGVATIDNPCAWYAYSADYGVPACWHVGLDVGVPKGTPIYALTAGVVSQAGPSPYFRPNPVFVTSDNGYIEIYGHLWSDTVTQGQRVKPGDQLGISGEQTVSGTMTPDGSGPHMHFELRTPDTSTNSGFKCIDPTSYLQSGGAAPNASANTTGGTAAGTSAPLGLAKAIGDYSQRGIFVLGGIILLAIGLHALLTSSSIKNSTKKAANRGQNAAKLLGSVGKFVPQAKMVSKVVAAT